MLRPFLFIITLLGTAMAHSQDWQDKIDQLFKTELSQGQVYPNLRYLCKEIGNRLSGSPGAAAAVEYTRALMESYGFDSVWLQPVMVPN